MKLVLSLLTALLLYSAAAQSLPADFQLVWSDEFNSGIKPDTSKWNFEAGFIRNRELQWYQDENAYLHKGLLIIEGRREKRNNPRFNPQQNNWRDRLRNYHL